MVPYQITFFRIENLPRVQQYLQVAHEVSHGARTYASAFRNMVDTRATARCSADRRRHLQNELVSLMQGRRLPYTAWHFDHKFLQALDYSIFNLPNPLTP
jgi:hypothetical protein